MTLRGQITTEMDLAGYERLGDALVPRKVRMTLAGQLGDPDAVVRFEVREGRPECVEFIVKAKPDGRGIKSSDLTMINIDSVAEAAFLDFATKADQDAASLGGADGAERWSLRRDLGEAIHAPGRGPSEAELREVARIYREHPNAPTSAVEKLLGFTRRTASRRVKQAREAGLL